MFRRAFAWYSNLLETRPLVTKGVTSATLMCSGDIFTQKVIEDGESEFNVRRAGSFLFFGSVLGPMLHPWFGLLARISTRVGGGLKGMAAAVAVDQTIMPPVLIGLFWLTQPVIEGKSFDEALELADKNFMTMLKGNYIVWPAAQAINFTLVPSQYRVLFVNIVSLGWNSFVSWLAHRDHGQAAPAIEAPPGQAPPAQAPPAQAPGSNVD